MPANAVTRRQLHHATGHDPLVFGVVFSPSPHPAFSRNPVVAAAIGNDEKSLSACERIAQLNLLRPRAGRKPEAEQLRVSSPCAIVGTAQADSTAAGRSAAPARTAKEAGKQGSSEAGLTREALGCVGRWRASQVGSSTFGMAHRVRAPARNLRSI